jgi:GTP-binding protein
MFDEAAVSYQVVLTKADKVAPAALARGLEQLRAELARHVAAHPDVAVTSAHEARGVAELRAALAAFAAP